MADSKQRIDWEAWKRERRVARLEVEAETVLQEIKGRVNKINGSSRKKLSETALLRLRKLRDALKEEEAEHDLA